MLAHGKAQLISAALTEVIRILQSKKKAQICAHLNAVPEEARSPFEHLLANWLSGQMEARIRLLGVRRLKIHVSWNDGPQVIYIEGLLGERYLELEIEPLTFSYACSDIEPDDYIDLPLDSPEQPYAVISHLSS